MTEPYVGEIRLMSFNFNPQGWAMCNGQLLPIAQNTALFSLLGTTYGGNGMTTFALPDLRGRVPVHVAFTHPQGERGGEQAHTLTVAEMPHHVHRVRASSAATGGSANPSAAFLGGGNNVYRGGSATTTLHPGTVANTGSSQAHTNLAPFLGLTFCMALQGIFPNQD